MMEVVFTDKQLDSTHGMIIAAAAPRCVALTKCDLANNHLFLQGCKIICQMMKTNVTITNLNLANNGFGVDSAKAIATMLQENKTLVHLDVSRNGLTCRDGGWTLTEVSFNINELLQHALTCASGVYDNWIHIRAFLPNKGERYRCVLCVKTLGRHDCSHGRAKGPKLIGKTLPK